MAMVVETLLQEFDTRSPYGLNNVFTYYGDIEEMSLVSL